MPSNGWTLIDISWTEDDGLQFYVNDTLSVRDQAGQPRTSVSQTVTISKPS